MITRDNLLSVLSQLSDKDKKRLRNTNKDYVVLELEVFNVSSYITMTLTNNYNRYKNISKIGGCIIDIEDNCLKQFRN